MIIDKYNKRDINKKLLIADRDGTLNIDYGYPNKLEDFKLIDIVYKLAELSNYFDLSIVTNQSGIGRKFFRLEDARIFNNHLVKSLSKLGINVTFILICPHKPSDECKCRKPNPSMVFETLKLNNSSNENSFMIGDKESDFLAASSAGVKFEYLDKKMSSLTKWLIQN